MTVVDGLIIAGLGAAGAVLRWGLTAWVTSYRRALMVVVVNSLGALGAGVGLAGVFGLWGGILAAGLWGSVTTLSTLAVDVVEHSVSRGLRPGLVLMALHIVGGLGGVWLGLALGGL